MKFKAIILLIVIIGKFNSLLAQDNEYQFSHLDIANGLSNNQVNCIFKDATGFLWFGTFSGLNRYDNYNFKTFKHEDADSTSINNDCVVNIFQGPDSKLWVKTFSGYCIYNPVNEKFDNHVKRELQRLHITDTLIFSIKQDRNGDFWFLSEQNGIYRYDQKTRLTQHFYKNQQSSSSLFSNNVTDITEDSKGFFWLVYKQGVIEHWDLKAKRMTLLSRFSLSNPQMDYYNFFKDSDDDIWLYSTTSPNGIMYLDTRTRQVDHYTKDSGKYKLKSNLISSVVEDDEGKIWIATDHGGIEVINKKNNQIYNISPREDDNKSIPQNSVILYKDNLGIIWAGTKKEGISYFHKNIIKFPLIRHYAGNKNSLSFEDVNVFTQDISGNIWIGTNGGGLIYYNRKAQTFKQYEHTTDNKSLSSDIITSLCVDHENRLWIGTYFGGLDCFNGVIFKHYRHNQSDPNSISDDRIFTIIEDSKNALWVGTFQGGVNIFDNKTQLFSHPFTSSQIRSPYISAIFEDKEKNIWVGGYMGVDMISSAKKGFIQHYSHDFLDRKLKIAGNNINCITQDSKGFIWIGTKDGLNILNKQHETIKTLNNASGLPDNTVTALIEDNHGFMWASTTKGLSRIKLTVLKNEYHESYKNYDETDGLQGEEFNVNAVLKLTDGELMFGGSHGINIFNPANIHPSDNKARIVFTDFAILNKSVLPGSKINGYIVLSKSINQTSSLILHYGENVFSIGYTALNIYNPNKTKFLYKLEGFNKEWISNSNGQRSVTYTNLDAGDYTFKVKAISIEDGSTSAEQNLEIKILPPFWKTPIAYLIYILSALGILIYIRHKGIQKLKNKFKLEQERIENQQTIKLEREKISRMQELDKMKTKFLTNVSHEFRTPISLIMAPVDKMLKEIDNSVHLQHVHVIKKNAKRLLNMVNQLLDFRKMEFHELKLNVQPGDIVKFIEETFTSFSDIAETKHISYIFDTDVKNMRTSFDHDKIERIMFNLLSNAFKFTPIGGRICVLVSLIPKKTINDIDFLEIKVADTGIGIPGDKLEKIFDRFFQNDIPGSMLNQGSGIGLSITSEFIKLLQGDIKVESVIGRGSCFIIRIPIIAEKEKGNLPDEKELKTGNEIFKEEKLSHIKIAREDSLKQTVLLVEDNEDFRFYLKDNLKEAFIVLDGSNGKEGWQKALAYHPDIIVSDISMPEMNGIDLCYKIKNDKRTSHIPVILLTALIGEAEELKGLEIGANDYITKPFNFEILVSKIKNLLHLQATFKKTYMKQIDLKLDDPHIMSADEKFITDIVKYVDQNVFNASISVNELSRHIGMNRNTLYKKLLSITGQSPVEYIRSLRLKKGAYLLEHSQMNVTEVAYEIGFNSPQYFAKSFKEEFGILPSEFIGRKRSQNVNIF